MLLLPVLVAQLDRQPGGTMGLLIAEGPAGGAGFSSRFMGSVKAWGQKITVQVAVEVGVGLKCQPGVLLTGLVAALWRFPGT